ncbi:hypothetical protein AA0Z99_00280 [Agrococcus sp. 1P02AA]|uniref:hypothetical protein n=1 Tax=Agrococcus sp. 1P02AA TaxID=3132259 RepID=UPI0039A61CB7
MATSFTFTRAGTLHADVERKLSQAVSEAFSTAASGTTLVALCDQDGAISRRFVSDGSNAKNRAFRIATSLNASSNQDEEPVDLQRPDLHRLAWRHGRSSVELDTQAGTALQAVADSIDANLMPGDWVAMSMREPTRAERSDWSRWFTHQRDARTHHSLRASSRIVSIWAGSEIAGRSAELVQQLTAALGGFDIIAPAETVSRSALMRPWWRATGISVLATAGAFVGAPYLAEVPELTLPTAWPWAVAAISACIAATTITKHRGIIGSGWTRIQRKLAAGLVPAPPRRLTPPRAPRKASTRWVGEGDERRQVEVPANDGEWPLAHSSFIVGPELVASLALPGATSTGSTASRRVPAALAHPIGPEIGASDGTTAHLSRSDMWAGVIVLGDPGSGKSKLLEWIVGEAMANTEYTSQAGVIFDTKRDGRLSRDLGMWAARASALTGQQVNLRVVRLADPTVPIKIDIFGRDGTLRQRAERIIDAMRYVEGDGIGARSKETLQAILPLAMLTTYDIAATVPGVDPEGSRVVAEAGILPR